MDEHLSKDWKKYATAIIIFIILLTVSWVWFFVNVENRIHENTAATIEKNIQNQGYLFKTAMALQYQFLEAQSVQLDTDNLLSERNKKVISAIAENTFIARGALIDADGMATYDNGEIRDLSERRYYKEIMQGKRTMSDPIISKLDGARRVIMAVPIFKSEEVIGGLCISYELEGFAKLFFEDIFEGAGYSLIVNQDGMIIALYGNEKYMKVTIDQNFFEYFGSKEIQEGRSIEDVKEAFQNQQRGHLLQWDKADSQNKRYLSYVPIEMNNWMMCYVVPEENAKEDYQFIRYYEWIITAVYISALLLLLGIFYMIGRNRHKELERNAALDLLTDVYNKKSMENCVSRLMKKNPETISAYIIVDVDFFKEINDTYGHAVGDEVLKEISKVLKASFRERDIIGRIGGDEFAVYMYDVSGRQVVEERLAWLCEEFRKLHVEPVERALTVSIGGAIFPDSGSDYLELYKSADQELYKVKKAGRNGYSI